MYYPRTKCITSSENQLADGIQTCVLYYGVLCGNKLNKRSLSLGQTQYCLIETKAATENSNYVAGL